MDDTDDAEANATKESEENAEKKSVLSVPKK